MVDRDPPAHRRASAAGGAGGRRGEPDDERAHATAPSPEEEALAGADEELERSTARRWRPIRLAHVLVATAVCAAALALTGLWEPARYGAYELVRNTVACAGLVTVATALAGAARAWAPLLAYVGVVYLAAPKPVDAGTAWWTWPVQPASAPGAWWAAAAWFAAGLVLYARNGARAEADRDA